MLELLQYRAWALSESYYNRMYPIVADAISRGHNLIKKKTISDYHSRIEALINVVDPDTDAVRVTYDFWTGKEIIPTVKSGPYTIALIPVIGPLTKYGDACSYGMQDYQRFMQIALKDEEVHGIVLIMDTPGGTVDGTPEMGLAVKNASKPVVVFGDGMVASAGLWIASQADVIVGNKNNPTEFGSIGVLMVNEDWSNVIESGRLPKMTIIRAPGSEEKALINPLEPLTDEQLEALRADLKYVRDQFVSTVKAGRGDILNVKTEGLFSGRMFDVTASKTAGLIDAIGSLSTAVNKVVELVKSNKRNSNSTSASKGAQVDTNMKFPKLSALFSGEAWGKALSVFADDHAPLESAEKKVADMEAEAVRLKAENGQLKADASTKDQKITTLETTVSEQSTQITTLTNDKTKLEGEKNELNEKLAKTPTGTKTTIIPDKKEEEVNADGNQSATDKKKYETSVDQEAAKIRAQQKSTKE